MKTKSRGEGRRREEGTDLEWSKSWVEMRTGKSGVRKGVWLWYEKKSENPATRNHVVTSRFDNFHIQSAYTNKPKQPKEPRNVSETRWANKK
jgi:hypothetical protein